MSKYIYEVVKEEPGYHIDSYSEMEVVETCEDIEDAMAACEKLDFHVHHFV